MFSQKYILFAVLKTCGKLDLFPLLFTSYYCTRRPLCFDEIVFTELLKF